MKLGVRAHDFGRLPPRQLSSTIRQAGFGAVQLAPTKAIAGIGQWTDVTPAQLKEIGQSFSQSDVEISILGCYIEPSLPDREERLAQVQNFLLGLSCAKALGVPFVGTETTHFDPRDGALREQRYQYLKDSVLRMVEEAERLDVCVAVETVADHTLNSAALTRRLLDEVGSDHLKAILDPVNLILAETQSRQTEIYSEFFRLLGDEIAVVHLKDIVFENGEKVWRNIGGGMIDNESVFQWLRQNKPHIAVLREHVHPDSSTVDLAAMRRLAGISK